MTATLSTDEEAKMREQVVQDGPPNLLSVNQVAHRLNVSTRTVRRLIATGEIVIYRIGRAVRIGEADLATYLTQTRNSPL